MAASFITIFLTLEVSYRAVALVKNWDNRDNIITFGFKKSDGKSVLQEFSSIYRTYPEGYYAFAPNIAFNLRFNSKGDPYPDVSSSKNADHINNLGLRSKQADISKENGIIRIIDLGSSSTYGFHVKDNETYPFQLQTILDNKFDEGRFEVINGGLPFFTSVDIEVLLHSLFLKMKPEVVTFYIGCNDSVRVTQDYYLKKRLGVRWEAVDWLSQYSFFLKMIKVNIKKKHRWFWDNDRKKITKKEINEFIQKSEPIFRDRVLRMQKVCEEHDIYPIFITQIYSSMAEYKRNNALDKIAEIEGLSYADYGSLLQAKDALDYNELVNYVHHVFTKTIRDISKDRLVDFTKLSKNAYYEHLNSHVHLTPKGNRVLARQLANYVTHNIEEISAHKF